MSGAPPRGLRRCRPCGSRPARWRRAGTARRANGVVLLAHLLAVAVEGVALGRPVAAVVVPTVRGLLVLPREVVEPAGVLPVAVPAVAAHDDAVRDQPVGFHDVRLDTRDRGVGRGAHARRLQPERGVPAGVLRQTAADLEVAVALHEERLAVRAERPEAGGVLRDVVGERAGLEMRRAEVVALAEEVEFHGLARHFHALEVMCERGEVLSPEAFAAHPLRLVDLRAVDRAAGGSRPCRARRPASPARPAPSRSRDRRTAPRLPALPSRQAVECSIAISFYHAEAQRTQRRMSVNKTSLCSQPLCTSA